MARSYESDANDNNMVKRDDSASSGPSSTETVPSTTDLGRRPVPVISFCPGLLHAMEEFRGDIPFTAEMLRRSTVDFIDNQLVLIKDVLEAAEIEGKYGFDRQFYVALTALGESLDLRIEEELAFFTQQKKLYTKVYEILRQSSFPYSVNQAACLNRMVRALYGVTGHPSAEADKVFVTELRELVRLLQLDDHLRDSTPHRVLVTNTIHFYLHGMLTKLDVLAKEEGERLHPDFIHPHSQIDLASYLVVNLDALIDMSKVLTPREHFHHGMVEIYTKFVEIFKKSGLEFSGVQEVVIQKIERRVRDLRKDPLLSKHHGIVDACLEFISELEENNPDREVTLEDDKVVWATDGPVNKAVREIGWCLIYLQPVATEHLSNFFCFGNGVINVVALVTERFLTLYPMR